MLEYHRLRKEKNEIIREMQHEGQFGKGTGRQIAAVASGLLSAIFIFFLAMFYFATNSAF